MSARLPAGLSASIPQQSTSGETASRKPTPPSSSSSTLTPLSALLPTPLETLLLSIYPATLVLGSLFSILAPHVQRSEATYDAARQSYNPPHLAPSYFAQKKNIFNVFFVKVGWFWVTTAFALFVGTNPFFGFRGNRVDAKGARGTQRKIGAVLRWVVATIIWTFVTQWFFGPPLIDRSFVFTGGACEVLADPEKVERMSKPELALTHAACRRIGGQWKGGHDISGHVFLLILGSGLLWMEVLPVLLNARGLRQDRIVNRMDGRITSAGELVRSPDDIPKEKDLASAVKEKLAEEQENLVTGVGVKFAIGVMALSWWMLLMTAAFFHTWFEKTTGLFVAFIGLWVVYFAPRGVPFVRRLVGMPGL